MTDSGDRRWRPEPWWLLVGLAGGLVWGVVAGLGVLALEAIGSTGYDALELAVYAAVAALFGATAGGAGGLVVGVVLAIVVGRGLPAESARPRAGLTGLVAGAAVGGIALLTLLNGFVHSPVLVMAVVAFCGLAAGATAWWFAPRMANRPRLARR